MKQLIITGDDFGLSPAVNEAIEIAHRDGILNTTSLMVGSPACADAVERARRLPGLRVGLHISVVRAKPTLDPAIIPDLVEHNGRLYENLVLAGFRFFFLPRVRTQLAAEIRAQFDAFRATGLALDHVNAHNHLHLHPTIINLIINIGKEYGVNAIRIPYEPVIDGDKQTLSQTIMRSFLSPWLKYLKKRLQNNGIQSNDYLFGIEHSGQMTVKNTLDLLARIPDGISELYFHPAVRNLAGERPHNDIEGCALELETLVNPDIKSALARLGIRPVSFADLVINHA